MINFNTSHLLLIGSLFVLGACQSAYYGTMEAFGKHKRDLLVSRVEAAREEQTEAKTEFKDALTQFTELVNHDGGDLRKAYDKAKAQYDDCDAKAKSVKSRIASIEEVGTALFKEWEQELDQYASDTLRQQSREQLSQTKVKYNDMLGAMKRASSSMDPVLKAFSDQVLFLKHNLNAQTVASLRGEVTRLEGEISSLLTQMERSIQEADQFIQNMGKNPS
jgi:chromosome segregation ATPase